MKTKLLRSVASRVSHGYGFLASFPFRMVAPKVTAPRTVGHSLWADKLAGSFNKPGIRVLEIGSRNVTGINLRARFSEATYVGFDVYPGENVDVVGDAHKLASYFVGQDRFDLIFSSAVLEHLCMPWVAAIQIQKMLKVGGTLFVETHFSYSSHERPWNFFQFSDMGLRALFNDALGFDLIESGMSNPLAGYFTHKADAYLRYRPVTELYCHSEILCKKRCDIDGFDWSQVDPAEVVDGTKYPAPAEHQE